MTETREVAIAAIEGALRDSWHEAAEQAGHDVSRTLTANLIAVSRGDGAPAMEEALARAVQRHPCRAFVVHGGGETLGAHLSTSTLQTGMGTAIVMERVELQCPDDEFDKLPGVIRPLLEGDIPGYLYWHGSLDDSARRLAPIGELIDRVIVDSSTFADPITDLGRMQSLTSENDLSVCDLNWFRLRPWRRALAEAFQHVEWTPDQPTRAVIHHPRHGHGLAGALRMAEWLRERLRASITLIRNDESQDHREPVEIAIATGDAFVRVHRMTEAPRLELAVTLPDQCHLPSHFPVSRGTPGDLLAAAMDGL